jgi:hypothetical protein
MGQAMMQVFGRFSFELAHRVHNPAKEVGKHQEFPDVFWKWSL